MATNFPGSADSFTNPTSGSSLSSPSHADQHANVNDAVEAIETALLDGAPLHIDDTNERVGIGTTSPQNELHIQDGSSGATADTGTYTQFVVEDSTNAGIHLISPDTGIGRVMMGTPSRQYGSLMRWDYPNRTYDIATDDASGEIAFRTGNFAERVRIDSSGNVGIGTTSPANRLEIYGGTADAVLHVGSGDAGSYITFADSTTTGAYWRNRIGINGNDLRFDTDFTNRMTITSSGNVGINSTNPTNILQVWNGTYYPLICRNDWGLRSTGTYALTTSNASNVYISSNGTFYRVTSSGKYKTDVEDMDTDAADVVFALRPVWFRSTSPHDPEGWSYYGLIAEEVAEVDPRLVSFGAREDCGCADDADHVAECLTEPEGVYYDRLVPHLISVVQRQQEQIDALTARIEALEAG